MAYALQQHLAPRVLQANGFSSAPARVNKSILAGCKYSVPFTRVYGLRQFIILNRNNPEANTELFVDDTSMHAAAETMYGFVEARMAIKLNGAVVSL